MKHEKVTSDIYLGAALLVMGAKLGSKPDRTDIRHVRFTFCSEDVDLDKVHFQWINEELGGNLVEYAEAIKKMKQLLHSE